MLVFMLDRVGKSLHAFASTFYDREQFKEGDKEADRGNDGKTSKSRLALNGIYYYGKPRTVRSGGSWV